MKLLTLIILLVVFKIDLLLGLSPNKHLSSLNPDENGVDIDVESLYGKGAQQDETTFKTSTNYAETFDTAQTTVGLGEITATEEAIIFEETTVFDQTSSPETIYFEQTSLLNELSTASPDILNTQQPIISETLSNETRSNNFHKQSEIEQENVGEDFKIGGSENDENFEEVTEKSISNLHLTNKQHGNPMQNAELVAMSTSRNHPNSLQAFKTKQLNEQYGKLETEVVTKKTRIAKPKLEAYGNFVPETEVATKKARFAKPKLEAYGNFVPETEVVTKKTRVAKPQFEAYGNFVPGTETLAKTRIAGPQLEDYGNFVSDSEDITGEELDFFETTLHTPFFKRKSLNYGN